MRHENMEFCLIQMRSLTQRQTTGNALAVAVHHKEVPNANR